MCFLTLDNYQTSLDSCIFAPVHDQLPFANTTNHSRTAFTNSAHEHETVAHQLPTSQTVHEPFANIMNCSRTGLLSFQTPFRSLLAVCCCPLTASGPRETGRSDRGSYRIWYSTTWYRSMRGNVFEQCNLVSYCMSKAFLMYINVASLSSLRSVLSLDLRHIKLRVSNPRTIACVHFNVPFGSSNLPGSGPTSPERAFDNWPHRHSSTIIITVVIAGGRTRRRQRRRAGSARLWGRDFGTSSEGVSKEENTNHQRSEEDTNHQ